MDKAILVIDMPKSCKECDIMFKDEYCEECSYDSPEPNGVYEYVQNETKPDWCPLRKIPEKLEGNDLIYYKLGKYKDGWNNCIDELIKE